MNFLKIEIFILWFPWKIRFSKCEFCQKWEFQNVNFVKNEIIKMWILRKLWFLRSQFCKNWIFGIWISRKLWFQKCEFCRKRDFQNVNFDSGLWTFGRRRYLGAGEAPVQGTVLQEPSLTSNLRRSFNISLPLSPAWDFE